MFQNVLKIQINDDAEKREGGRMAKKLEREIIIKTSSNTEPPDWTYLAEVITKQILKGVHDNERKSKVQ